MKITHSVFILSLCLTISLAANAADQHKRIYMIGNSLTDDIVYPGFKQVVTQGGDTVTLGSHRIPGATIAWLWDNSGGGFVEQPYGAYANAFTNYVWDAVTLQPFSGYEGELRHARYFAQALRGDGTLGPGPTITPEPGDPTGISPNATLYLYAQWPDNLLTGWDNSFWLLNDHTRISTARFYEKMVEDMQVLEPETTTRLIPVGHVFHELNMQSRAGKIPGISGMADWLQDSRHLNDAGGYVVGLTFFATIYQEDPRGRVPVSNYPVTAAQATAVQEAVWRVVSNHPLTGIPSSLVITSPSLPDALEGTAYNTTLKTGLASGAVTWSVVGGALPTGMTLSSNGDVSGNSTTAGAFEFTVRAEDAAGNIAERTYILFVLSNNPPVITSPLLPPARVGTPYNFSLTHEGGFGSSNWSIASGDLPRGLTLSPSGVIQGTPTSQVGQYRITLQVTDEVPSVAAREFGLVLGEPEEGTITLGRVSTPPVMDGFLSEDLWAARHALNQELAGSPDAGSNFSVRWDNNAIYVAVQAMDESIIDGEDAIHIMLDGLHDREVVFNADDRNIQIYSNGTWTELNSRPTGILVAVHKSAGSWSAEVTIPFSNLERSFAGENLTIGFDVCVVDVDPGQPSEGILSWWGTSPENPQPITMGNLILDAAPIATNLIKYGDFPRKEVMLTYPYPSKAAPDRTGSWVWTSIGSRTMSSVDGTTYGYPDSALVAYGTPGMTIYQVIHDAKTTKGNGYLRFDVKDPHDSIAYRVFAYNGTAVEVTPRMGTVSQAHPPGGGTPDATLASGTLGGLLQDGTWRMLSVPINFGQGYDYYIVAISGGSGLPLGARIDNVAFGAEMPVRVAAGAPKVRLTPEVLVSADLSGTRPASKNPLTETLVKHPRIIFDGLRRGSGISPGTGDNAYFFGQDSGQPRGTLARAIQRNDYLEMLLTAQSGTQFDLAGGVVQFTLNRRSEGSSVRVFDVFTSVEGFTEGKSIARTAQVPASGNFVYAFAFPETDIYRGLTSASVRIYGYDGEWANRYITLNSFDISGVVEQPTLLEAAYANWQSSIDWGNADSSMNADPNKNGLSNMLEMFFDLPEPSLPTDPSLLPHFHLETTGSGSLQTSITYRKTTQNTGLVTVLESSPDLLAWSPVIIDGITASDVVVNADVDGDGTAELRKISVNFSNQQSLFLRLAMKEDTAP